MQFLSHATWGDCYSYVTAIGQLRWRYLGNLAFSDLFEFYFFKGIFRFLIEAP